jgi:Alpha/beta hydrolase domain
MPRDQTSRTESARAHRTRCWLALASAALCASAAGSASAGSSGKVFLHIAHSEIVAGGHDFGAGPYEKIAGTVEFQIDPKDPRNAVITDLDLAPRNKAGLVTFDADFMVLRPADMSRWNRQVVSEINNRGNLLLFLSFASAGFNNNPSSQADFGNGFFLDKGYALAWVGWGGDVLPGGGRVTLRVPAPIQSDGKPVTQKITIELSDEFSFAEGGGDTCAPLSGSGSIAGYPAVLAEKAQDELFVRSSDSPRPSAPPIPAGTRVPDAQWHFGDSNTLCVAGGFQTGMVYQLNYVAEDTRIMGLGYAAQRDFASFLRNRKTDDAGVPNPLASHGGVATSIVYGASQSGVYLRDYVYQGFNEDVHGRRVFDAVHAHIAGAVKLGLNYRFSQVHPWATEHRDRFIPQVTFPFNFGVRQNPLVALGIERGPLTDGILKRPASDPLFVQTDSSTEYWWGQSSLVDTDGFGHGVALPWNARHYVIVGTEHFQGFGAVPDRGLCQQLSNPVHQGPALRAIFTDLDAWATKGIEPPPSRRATVEGKLLEPPQDRAKVGFPAIPGVTYNGLYNALGELNFGPFVSRNRGVITNWGHPPVIARYDVLVPKVNSVGIDRGGVQLPVVGVPTATLTGWNLRRAPYADGEVCELNGMFVPLHTTEDQAEKAGDPRPSLEKLYRTHRGYVRAVEHFVRKSVQERFLLPADAEAAVSDAEKSDVLVGAGQ